MTDEPTAERPPWEKDRTKGWAAKIRGLPARARRRRGLRRRAYPSVDEAHAPGHRKLGPPPEERPPTTSTNEPQPNQPWIRTSHSDSQQRRFRR